MTIEHGSKCTLTPGCKGTILVSRAERIPGHGEYTALCNTCGAARHWQDDPPQPPAPEHEDAT